MQGLCCLLCLLHHPPLPWPLITVLPANTHMSTFRKTSPLLSYTDRQSGHWILRWKSAGNIDSVSMCMARWLHNYYTSKEPILENPQRSRKKYTVAICKRKKKTLQKHKCPIVAKWLNKPWFLKKFSFDLRPPSSYRPFPSPLHCKTSLKSCLHFFTFHFFFNLLKVSKPPTLLNWLVNINHFLVI